MATLGLSERTATTIQGSEASARITRGSALRLAFGPALRVAILDSGPPSEDPGRARRD
jgi:hypothetical protein